MYAVPVGAGQTDPGKLSVVGPKSFFGAVSMIQDLFDRACDAVMTNSTLLAQLEVRTSSPSCFRVNAADFPLPAAGVELSFHLLVRKTRVLMTIFEDIA